MQDKLWNKQNPPVYQEHILAAGLMLFIDHPSAYNNYSREGYNVYDRDDNFICAFDDVEWGYGASGMLCYNHTPIHDYPVQVSKVEEIRSARKNAEEANLYLTTAPCCKG
jgi:hypothetical protein